MSEAKQEHTQGLSWKQPRELTEAEIDAVAGGFGPPGECFEHRGRQGRVLPILRFLGRGRAFAHCFEARQAAEMPASEA